MNERESIRFRLITNNLSFAWLIQQLDRYGIAVDRTVMSAVMAGTRRGPKADSIIRKSVEILDDYDAYFKSRGVRVT